MDILIPKGKNQKEERGDGSQVYPNLAQKIPLNLKARE